MEDNIMKARKINEIENFTRKGDPYEKLRIGSHLIKYLVISQLHINFYDTLEDAVDNYNNLRTSIETNHEWVYLVSYNPTDNEGAIDFSADGVHFSGGSYRILRQHLI